MAKKDPKHGAMEKLDGGVAIRGPWRTTLLDEGLAVLDGKRILLTPAGKAALEACREAERQAAAMPRPRAAKASAVGKPGKPSTATRLAQVERTVEDVLARLARIEAQGARPVEAAPAVTVTDLAAVKETLLGLVKELDLSHRYGGLVPIPDLRRAARVEGIDDAGVNAGLESLERDYRIDLNVAQAPAQVPDPSAGIHRPGRGLLYYVVRRGT